MSSFNTLFKDEVRRLARKELKDNTSKLQRDIVELKRTVSDQKKRISDLERDNKRLMKSYLKKREASLTAEPKEVRGARITSKSIRDLRAKLGLTQAEFATLAGVTGQSVYQWERKDDRLQLRQATKAAIVEIRKMGVRDARRRLEELEG